MSKSESLLHWEKKFRDGTVDDEHRDFIADTLAAARKDMRNNYRVEVVQTNVFYIEAESPDQARDIATIDHIWDEDQTGKNSYDIGFNITKEKKSGEDFCQACEDGTCSELTTGDSE